MPGLWAAVGIVCVVDAIWSAFIGLTISNSGNFLIAWGLFLVVTVLLRTNGRDPRLAVATEFIALWQAFASSANILTYLSATPALPLQDDFLADADGFLGFRWLSYYHYVEAHPFIGRSLTTCYQSLIPETVVSGIFLSFARFDHRIRDFFWIALTSLLLTSALSALVPAVGAFSLYGFPERADWLRDLDVLRRGVGLHFAFPAMVGLVTFPSFHAVLALLVIYVMRGTGFIFYLFAAWNLIMLVSIPPIGGHYLVDIVGGAAVLGIAIVTRRSILHLRSPAHATRKDLLPSLSGEFEQGVAIEKIDA